MVSGGAVSWGLIGASRMGCVSPMLVSEEFSVIADGTVGTSLSLPSMVAVKDVLTRDVPSEMVITK